MENNVNGRAVVPVLVLFVLSSVFVGIGRSLLAGWGVDYRVLLVGGGLLFLVTLVSFSLYSKALRNANVQVFLRMMYSSVLVKMFVCLLAVFIYAMIAQRAVNRNGILGCFILYIVYTVLEVRVLMQLSKKSPKNV